MRKGFVEIRGFPDYYINKKGVVISTKSGECRTLKQFEDAYGYIFVCLYDANGRQHHMKLHRLLAETFIENTEQYPWVRHHDDNKKNNKLSNLRWGTPKHNSEDMVRNGHSTRKKVYCYETETTYDSINIAASELGLCPSDITECMKGTISHTRGYHFDSPERVDLDKTFTFKQRPHRFGTIVATNIQTGEVLYFDSQKEAGESLGIFASNISMCLSGVIKQCKSWTFRFKEEDE